MTGKGRLSKLVFGLLTLSVVGCNMIGTGPKPTDATGKGNANMPSKLGPLIPATEEYWGLSRVTQSDVGKDFDPYVQDGKIVFASTKFSPKSDIYVKRTNGGRAVTQITFTPNADEKQPQVSPNGRHIVYASNKEGKWNIYQISSVKRGAEERELIRNGRINEQPCYSPDGKKIAYVTWIPTKANWHIEIMDLMTEEKVTYGPGLFPKFSPDGKTLVFQKSRVRSPKWYALFTLNLETGHVHEIVSNNDWAAITPNWSPDGKKIVFSTVNKSLANKGPWHADDIWTVWKDGTHLVRLTNDQAPDWNPIWANDGYIYFISLRNTYQNIWKFKARPDHDEVHPETLEGAGSNTSGGILDIDIP